jgi:hypothetical protein
VRVFGDEERLESALFDEACDDVRLNGSIGQRDAGPEEHGSIVRVFKSIQKRYVS